MTYENTYIQEVHDQFDKDLNALSYSDLKNKYLSRNGKIKEVLSKIKEISNEEKRKYGQQANELTRYITEKLQILSLSTNTKDETETIDPTAPFDINAEIKNPLPIGLKGTRHPLMQEMKNVLDIFKRMGFDILESRQLDDDYHMFETLNIPKGHPARDIWDTFWTEEGLIPPAHTSTMQNRALKSKQPPIHYVIPGRCYRNEATDASHEHTFYQIEGVYVDKNISLGDMLGTIKTYLEAFFETNLDIKVQPAYFPFTEPDMEFMISCPFCKKTGCNVCKHTGWIEIMGCGMIHPEVLKQAGIDSDKYSGFAWGFGLDRLVMLKNGIQDVRRFHSGDLNFLKQF